MKSDIAEQVVAIIPSLDPDHKLTDTVASLKETGFARIVLVNDGSGEEHLRFFEELKSTDGVSVLTHSENRGKGAALKTAFDYVYKDLLDIKVVITVDGDGQHKSEDVMTVAQNALEKDIVSLGCRDFSTPDVPFRSKLGNKTMSFVFRVIFGLKIRDTQTGLRAYPRRMLPRLCEVDGERFEYETNTLLDFKRNSAYGGVEYDQVPIETVYIEENSSSHYRPVVDTVRIFRILFKFLIASMLSFAVDISMFFLIAHFITLPHFGETLWRIGTFELGAYWLAAFIPARAVSSYLNYLLNLKVVFAQKNKKTAKGAVFRYYTLAVCQLTVLMVIFQFAAELLGVREAFLGTVLNVGIQIILFIVSFKLQHYWVFRENRKAEEIL